MWFRNSPSWPINVMRAPYKGPNVVAIVCVPLLPCAKTATSEADPKLFNAVIRR